LALSGFELYGKVVKVGGSKPLSFRPAANGEDRGIIYHLGANKHGVFHNPVKIGAVAVSASTVLSDSSPPTSLLTRALLRFSTKAKSDSWVMFDLRARRVQPTHYSLRHYSTWDTEALRNWVLEGSNDRVEWVTLREHKADASLNKKGATKTWALSLPAADEAYQFFRVRQVGLNSNNHNYLALSGFELYGELSPASARPMFAYQSDFDEHGLMYHLGTSGGHAAFVNPVKRGRVQVSASSVQHDSAAPHELLSRRALRFSTKAENNAWVMFTLDARVKPTHYSLRHYTTWDTEALRTWVLEGSNDGKRWTTLRDHKDDASLNKKGATRTWALSGPATNKAYRMFRVRQTGLNSNRHKFLALSGFELYGELMP
jgi:hypothetical protein